MLKKLKGHLLPDWQWVVNHSWSVRLIMLAFTLSVAEALMPFFTPLTHQVLYGLVTSFVTGGAFIARMFAQKRHYQDSK